MDKSGIGYAEAYKEKPDLLKDLVDFDSFGETARAEEVGVFFFFFLRPSCLDTFVEDVFDGVVFLVLDL